METWQLGTSMGDIEIIDSSNRFALSPLRGVPEGEHLLDDYLICSECVLAFSLIGASYDR